MAVALLPLSRSLTARVLLHHLLEHSDIVGRDTAGRTIIQMAVEDRILEELMIFDADAAELELDPDEEDGPPTGVELVQPIIVKRGPLCRQAASTDSMPTCGDDPAQ